MCRLRSSKLIRKTRGGWGERGGRMLWFTVVPRRPYVSVLFLPHNFFFDLVMMKVRAS